MNKRPLFIFALVGLLWVFAGFAMAADQERIRERIHTEDQERLYGSQLMTQEEQNEFHERMRAAKTEQEREQIREEHHERMQERAQEQGITLPDQPSAGSQGMDSSGDSGMKHRSGGGMGHGSGGGMGHGGGRGR